MAGQSQEHPMVCESGPFESGFETSPRDKELVARFQIAFIEQNCPFSVTLVEK
jgi:hypothetical protein